MMNKLKLISLLTLAISFSANADWFNPCSNEYFGLFKGSNSQSIEQVERLLLEQEKQLSTIEKQLKYDVNEAMVIFEQELTTQHQQFKHKVNAARASYLQTQTINVGSTQLTGLAAKEQLRMLLTRAKVYFQAKTQLAESKKVYLKEQAILQQNKAKMTVLNVNLNNASNNTDEIVQTACLALKNAKQQVERLELAPFKQLRNQLLNKVTVVSDMELAQFVTSGDIAFLQSAQLAKKTWLDNLKSWL